MVILRIFSYYVVILCIVLFKAQAAVYRFSDLTTLNHPQNFEIKNNLNKASIKLNLKEVKIDKKKNDKYAYFSSSNFSMTKEEGLPEIPYKNFLVLGDYRNLKIHIKKGRMYSFENLFAAPASTFPCRCSKDEKVSRHFDKDKYYSRSDKLYKITPLGDYRGQKLFLVTLYMAMIKNDKKIDFFPQLEFHMTDITSSILKVLSDDKLQVEFPLSENNKSDLVIIGKEELLVGAKKYIKLKRDQGVIVHTYNLIDIGESFPKLDEFFKDLYSTIKMNYVIILGDEDLFPTDYLETSNHPLTPSDISYFLMGGDEDKIPDVFYGRISATNSDEVERQLRKSDYFETQKGLGNTVIGIASNEGEFPSDMEYMDKMLTPLVFNLGMREDEFFQDQVVSNPDNLNRSLSRGALWLNYIGHGDGRSWPSFNKGEYTTDHVQEIVVQKTLPVIIDVACQNGKYSRDDRLGMEFMNAFLPGGQKGATSYYGGTVDISWHPPAIMAVGINQYLAKKKSQTLGEVLFLGQLHLLSNYDDVNAAHENLIWYNLQGTPNLSLFKLYK